ncbi:hypothetical protein HD806DRAFT_43606 [Xylariaceae sp. AK1471]|nr:hypothetical protein HD806DRAFT_43606 [Xylariaceae sp. AK1471]
MPPQGPVCQALNLSDGKQCTEVATIWDDLFCRFHGKQCHGLYAGYKRRNAQLDGLAEQAPLYLKSKEAPLANERILRQVHSHLFLEYVLLGKVIDARKLHHKHFYPRKFDYGHQAYLDTLSNRRHIVLRALERLEKRTAEVLYEKEKWFKWVRDVQHEEEVTRDKEAKKVKLEAAMFKRHWKKMEIRLQAQREKEEKRRQEAFLEAVYQERMNAVTENDTDEEMWDPIEDFVEDERSRYVDLIKHFLWMEIISEKDEKGQSAAAQSPDLTNGVANLAVSEINQKKKPKKKSKTKASIDSNTSVKSTSDSNANLPRTGRTGQAQILAMMDNVEANRDVGGKSAEPDMSNIETEEEMRTRLKEGIEKNYDDIRGPILVGSLEIPHGTHEKTAPMGNDEIETLMQDIKEIKLLLFCRLLLSHASLLPAALRAANVNEFLNDADITEADLRDLCLKVEQPSLQDIRDACADLIRGDEPDVEEDEDDIFDETSYEDIILQDKRYGHFQDPEWFVHSMIAHRSKELGESASDAKRYAKSKRSKMKVQICGKSIWNYSSESSMTRDGWLQFSVLARDCDLKYAVQLCRNWDEFSQLNFLASWQYFPASNWVSWGSDRMTKQLHDLGFFPFFTDLDAKSTSHHHQVGGARSQVRRKHHYVEARNLMVGHMKRKDPVTRRFLQYCSMRTGELLLAVRDGRTEKVITAPDDEDALWTLRYKMGMGRAAKNDWETVLEVGPDYFEGVELYRNWHLGFDDYYEVWIWDFAPGRSGVNVEVLYNVIVEELRKASRIRKPIDMYNNQEPFLRTLTRDKETLRVRSIKPGEQAQSLWDEVQDPENVFYTTDLTNNKMRSVQGDRPMEATPHLFYNEANEAEDAVLFPDELVYPNRVVPFKEVSNAITRLEIGAGTLTKYLAQIAKNMRLHDKLYPKSLNENSDGDESLSIGDSTHDIHGADSIDAQDEDKELEDEYFDDEEGTVTKHWRLPQLWEEAIKMIDQSCIDIEKKKLLGRVGLFDDSSGRIRKTLTDAEFAKTLKGMDRLMLMEKDRGDGMSHSWPPFAAVANLPALLEAFHAGDLEPGAPERYVETCAIVNGILSMKQYAGSRSWLWFALETLEWLGVRADYTEYVQNMTAPWPHPFITQDILKSWAYMASFFPELEQCDPAIVFFESEEGQKYHNSLLHKPYERSQTLPDVRTPTSFRYRSKAFWREWENTLSEAEANHTYYADAFPMEWSVVIRPIIAKLYLAGIVSPMLMQNDPQIVPGFAIANTEPHRPGKLDLFIDYADRKKAGHFPTNVPGLVRPDQFPVLLPIARDFEAKNKGARFAVLRLWSAPHFYPAMLGDHNRMGTAFLDSAARSWRWNFIPKDMPISEWSMYNNLYLRLDLLKKQFGDRVIHRSEIVLVMGLDQLDLLRYATAVTFAVQTKPWFREFDLWKSFINVDIGFLEGLDPYWLD